MEGIVLSAVVTLIKDSPALIASMQKLFSKGVPTQAEIDAEIEAIEKLTLDDVEPPTDPLRPGL